MYLDPGFGGMLLQIIVALVAAGGATLFAMRRKLRAMFSKNKKATSNNDIAAKSPVIPVADDDVIDMLSETEAE